ncbi:recombinase family protein [Paradesulfitobacterium aromaticivorans]
MTKVAIYIRVSTKRQKDNYSPSVQKRAMTEHAQKMGWEIFDYYSDLGESGGDIDREDLDRLMRDAKRGCFSRVLVLEQDRLSRLEQIDWVHLADSLAKLSIKLVTPTSEVNLSNEEERFMADLLNLIANRDKKKIKRTTARGRREAHHAGIYFGSTTAFGVEINRETQEWYTVPREVEISRIIFDKYSSSFGFNAVARYLNSKGYKSKKGGNFTQRRISDIISNPVCIGEFEQTILGETIRHKMKWVPDHGSYITRSQYYKAQEIAKERGEIQALWEPKYLLIGLLVCDECGRKFQSHGSVNTLASGSKKTYYSYLHRDALKTCRARHKMGVIHEQILSILKSVAGNPQVLSQMLNENTKKDNIEAIEAQVNQCKEDRSKVLSKKSKLLDLYMAGGWDITELNNKKHDLEQELEHLDIREQELTSKLTIASQNLIDVDLVAEALSVFNNFDELYDKEQIELLRSFISEIRVKKTGEMKLFFNVDIGDNYQSNLGATS